MKRSVRAAAMILAVLCLTAALTGCGDAAVVRSPEVPALTVYIPMDLEKTSAFRALRDPLFARQVEETLGLRLDVRALPADMDYNEVALLDVSGILLTDDPAWVVPLAESRKITAIDAVSREPGYGQYNNSAYGYVLEDPSCAPRTPVILANLEALRSLGISRTEFTPENVYEILAELKVRYRVPLAVSGMPTDAGFAPLLALFGLAPSGGREMYIEGGSVVYDKLSEDAEDYLEYVSTLYAEGLIPVDALELTEYGCAKLIAQNAAAMAVFTDETAISRAIAYAKENDRELVTVSLPVPEAELQTGIFSRVVGYVGKDALSREDALAFFGLLQEAVLAMEPAAQDLLTDRLGQYKLFFGYAWEEARQDPREVSPMYVYWLYQKENLDTAYLDTAYCKILFGEAAPEDLEAAAKGWQEDSNLLGLIGGRYWAHIRDTEVKK